MNESYWFQQTQTKSFENFKNIDVNIAKLSTTNINNTPMFCGKGQYLESSKNTCNTCPINRYQDKTNHRRFNCEPHADYSNVNICPQDTYFFQNEIKVTELKKTIKDRQLTVDDMCKKHVEVKTSDCKDDRYLNPLYLELRKSFKSGPLDKDNPNVCMLHPTFTPNNVCGDGTYFDTDKHIQLKNNTKDRAITENDITKSVCTPHAIVAADCNVRTYFDVSKYNKLSKEKQVMSTMKEAVCLNQDKLVAGQCADGTYFYEAGLDTVPKNKKATADELKKVACKPHTEYKKDLEEEVKASGKFFNESKWNSNMVSKSKLKATDVADDFTKCDMFQKLDKITNTCVECPPKHLQSETDPTVCSPYSSVSGWVEPNRYDKPGHGVINWGVLNGKATDLNKCIKYLKDNNIKDASRIGRRTENTPDPAWKNSCWFYTKTSDNATNHIPSNRKTDNMYEMICIDENLRPKPCVENSCPNSTDYIQTIDGKKYCTPHNTCGNGEELIGANNNSPGVCRQCLAGTYKNGQNREMCTPHTVCPPGQRLVGGNESSDGRCEWIPIDCVTIPIYNGKCDSTCGYGKKRNFIITQHPLHGGKACPPNEEENCKSVDGCANLFQNRTTAEFYWDTGAAYNVPLSRDDCAFNCQYPNFERNGRPFVCKGFLHNKNDNKCHVFSDNSHRRNGKTYTYTNNNNIVAYRRVENGWPVFTQQGLNITDSFQYYDDYY